MDALATVLPANWTNTSTFKCGNVQDLPFYGAEILVITILYVLIISMYCVTFIDVAIKQMWPDTFLDSEVMKRVKKLQADFPGIMQGSSKKKGATCIGANEDDPLGLDDESQWDPVTKVMKADGTLATVTYDSLVSQEALVATCCVDEDMTFILANNDAYSTVSGYCSSTVRGYVAISTILPIGGAVLGFLWIHNATINPIGDNYARYTGIVGYFLCFLTGSVMYTPNSMTVHRTRNMLLWNSIPVTSWISSLHDIGVIGFAALPMLGNLYQVIEQPVPGHVLPNREMMWIGIVIQVIGFASFLGPDLAVKIKLLTQLQANKIGIIGELIALLGSMITFLQIETYASAACVQSVSTYGAAIIGAMVLIFSTLCIKHYTGAPVGPSTNGPSVMLMHGGIPVATSGPVPVLNYNREMAILPIIQPAAQE